MQRLSGSILLLLVLTGCAATQNFQRPDTSQADFQKDQWECQQIVNQSYSAPSSQGGAGAAIGHAIGRAMSENQRLSDCMLGRGYQVSK